MARALVYSQSPIIRGGRKFGPDWHKAGMRAGKKLGHDDFAAIDKDLIARLVTLPQRLAGKGGSNGGHSRWQYAYALSGPVRTHQLRRAALDMKRYTNLTAGSSWVSEYGDAEDWVFLQELLPYHHVAPHQSYPPILLTTSARDDRMHLGHAQDGEELAAQGHAVYFHEPLEGGHAGAIDNAHLPELRVSAHGDCIIMPVLGAAIRRSPARAANVIASTT